MNTRPRKARHLLLIILIAVIAFLLLMPTKVHASNYSPITTACTRVR
ncbi:hypothetical protein [Pseudomonas fluorescens]|nr:hypothetical protein [Pseudomonas fluorescens]MBT2375225.1 hypothetical protein [Pseudomonas fluorescens]